MSRRRWSAVFTALTLAAAFGGCTAARHTRPAVDPPPPGLTPTRLDYADSDAFDALFETALTNEDPVILVQTTHSRPDWGDRLNAWIMAWNMGGKPRPGEKVRMQAPFVPKVTVDGDSIREFRLLVDGLMTRLDDRARAGRTWVAEERTMARRVKLLKPYNLRFHMDENDQIELIFFNGRYAEYHREFVRGLGCEDDGAEWERGMVCSMCAMRKSSDRNKTPGRLTSAGATGDE